MQQLLLVILHPFNGLFSRTTWVSRHQKGKSFWILLEPEMGWQWHQLDHTQITAPRSRQITTPVPHHSVFTGQMPFMPPNQQRQSTKGRCRKLQAFTRRRVKLHCSITILLVFIFIAFGFRQLFKNNKLISNSNCKLQQTIHICFWRGMLLRKLCN